MFLILKKDHKPLFNLSDFNKRGGGGFNAIFLPFLAELDNSESFETNFFFEKIFG